MMRDEMTGGIPFTAWIRDGLLPGFVVVCQLTRTSQPLSAVRIPQAESLPVGLPPDITSQ